MIPRELPKDCGHVRIVSPRPFPPISTEDYSGHKAKALKSRDFAPSHFLGDHSGHLKSTASPLWSHTVSDTHPPHPMGGSRPSHPSGSASRLKREGLDPSVATVPGYNSLGMFPQIDFGPASPCIRIGHDTRNTREAYAGRAGERAAKAKALGRSIPSIPTSNTKDHHELARSFCGRRECDLCGRHNVAVLQVHPVAPTDWGAPLAISNHSKVTRCRKAKKIYLARQIPKTP